MLKFNFSLIIIFHFLRAGRKNTLLNVFESKGSYNLKGRILGILKPLGKVLLIHFHLNALSLGINQ